MNRLGVLMILLASLPGVAARAEDPFRFVPAVLPPKTPDQSRDCLQVREGFCVELAVAEPDVIDPIAIDWGPDGKLWVVEMGGYPLGGDRDGPGGRVRVLEDTDGDGRYDRSQVFLDGLAFPTGLLVWGKGVLITCAPDIIFAADTNGDGSADQRRVVLTGLVEGNPQHNVNGLVRGLDNWIHAANGDNGGVLQSPKSAGRVDLHARDFRFDPERGSCETQSGMSQFSLCRDDWGNWFGGNNLRPLWHRVLDDHYLRRNRFLAPPSPCVDLADPELGTRVFVRSQQVPRFNEPWTFNLITAGCGATIYRDDLWGPAFSHSWFVCEPAHNLVHHEMLRSNGVTFSSHRPPEERESEFLASSDIWFRPVQARTGPDGALWIVDMYRLVIEHPDYIPAHWMDRLDLRAGSDRGRIYRVYPAGTAPRKPVSMAGMSTAELVAVLCSPNGPRRDMAQQLLAAGSDPAAVAPLQGLVRRADHAKSRLSALCTLDALSAIDASLVCRAMNDQHPDVRRHAVRLSERLLNDDPTVQAAVLARVADANPRVRMQVAYSLGEWRDARASRALAQLAACDADDPFVEAAITSSASYNAAEVLKSILRQDELQPGLTRLISNLLRQALESGEQEVLVSGLERVLAEYDSSVEAWQLEVIAEFLDGVDHQASSLDDLRRSSPPRMANILDRLEMIFASARELSGDGEQDGTMRTQAIRLLGRQRALQEQDVATLAGLLAPQIPAPLQEAAIATLSRCDEADLPAFVLRDWSQLSPTVRSRVLDLIVGRKDWTLSLLGRIEQGGLSAAEIGAVHRGKLLLHSSSEVRRRASKSFPDSSSEDRQALIARYLAGSDRTGDMQRGRQLFRQHCANCHVLEEQGVAVGPDLHTLTDYSTETLLVAILDPNLAPESALCRVQCARRRREDHLRDRFGRNGQQHYVGGARGQSTRSAVRGFG